MSSTVFGMRRAKVRAGLVLAAAIAATTAACGDEPGPAVDTAADGADVQRQEDRQSGSSESSSQSIQSSSSSGSQSSSQVQSSSGGGGLSTFSGSGRSSIDITVDEESRLAWTNTEGSRFTVESDSPRISIDSTSGSGETILQPGSYEDIEVRGDAWTMVVRTR